MAIGALVTSTAAGIYLLVDCANNSKDSADQANEIDYTEVTRAAQQVIETYRHPAVAGSGQSEAVHVREPTAFVMRGDFGAVAGPASAPATSSQRPIIAAIAQPPRPGARPVSGSDRPSDVAPPRGQRPASARSSEPGGVSVPEADSAGAGTPGGERAAIEGEDAGYPSSPADGTGTSVASASKS